MRIAEKLGIHEQRIYATMLLNIGTAQRVMGQMDKAESTAKKPMRYLRKVYEPDYRMATLIYNNRSILYANTGS